MGENQKLFLFVNKLKSVALTLRCLKDHNSVSFLILKNFASGKKMRKENPVRYSSAVGEARLHVMFKVKYYHKIFDILEVREECYRLLQEAAEYYSINLSETGFDSDHLHFIADLGLRSKPEIAKCLKGYVARKLLAKFPDVKKRYFWDSGLWNPSYYMV